MQLRWADSDLAARRCARSGSRANRPCRHGSRNWSRTAAEFCPRSAGFPQQHEEVMGLRPRAGHHPPAARAAISRAAGSPGRQGGGRPPCRQALEELQAAECRRRRRERLAPRDRGTGPSVRPPSNPEPSNCSASATYLEEQHRLFAGRQQENQRELAQPLDETPPAESGP